MSEEIRVAALMRAQPDVRERVEQAVLACVPPSREEKGNVAYNTTSRSKTADLHRHRALGDAGARARHLQPSPWGD